MSHVKEKGANFKLTSSESLLLIGLLEYSGRRFDLLALSMRREKTESSFHQFLLVKCFHRKIF